MQCIYIDLLNFNSLNIICDLNKLVYRDNLQMCSLFTICLLCEMYICNTVFMYVYTVLKGLKNAIQ